MKNQPGSDSNYQQENINDQSCNYYKLENNANNSVSKYWWTIYDDSEHVLVYKYDSSDWMY